MQLHLIVHGVKNFCWELSRTGPDGLERVMQHDKLPLAIEDILQSTLDVDYPEHTRFSLTFTVTIPEGDAP